MVFLADSLVVNLLCEYLKSEFIQANGGMGDFTPESDKDVDNKGLYEALEISTKATNDEIKKAYKKKALKHHPDRGGDPEKVNNILLNQIT